MWQRIFTRSVPSAARRLVHAQSALSASSYPRRRHFSSSAAVACALAAASLYYTAQSSATLHLESPASIADESTKTLFPTSIRHDNKDYRLLGLGVRQVTLLRISVYVLGLYIPDSTVLRPDVTSLADLVRSPVPLAIRLEPVRNTTGAHLRDGFVRTLLDYIKRDNLTGDERDKAMDVINDFKAKFPKGSISKGEVLTLYRNADGQVEIEYQGTSYGTIRSSWLASSLFLAYVREDSPISPKARQSILEGYARSNKH